MNTSLQKTLVAAGVTVLAISAAFSQNDLSFADVLKGTSVPTKVKIADLPEGFKAARLTITGEAGNPMSGMGGLAGMLMPFFAMAKPGSATSPSDVQAFQVMQMLDVVWVNPEAVSIEGHKFLMTYKLPGMAFMMLDKVKPEQLELELNLVRGDMISAVSPLPEMTKAQYAKSLVVPSAPGLTAPGAAEEGVAPGVVPEHEVTIPHPDAQTEEEARTNFKWLGKGLLMYIDDNNNRFPKAQDSWTVLKALKPYVKNDAMTETLNPNGGRILFDMVLAGKRVSTVKYPAQTVAFFDSKEWPRSRHLVAFVDGHVKFVSDTEWAKVQPKPAAAKSK